jgi:hypothetical protein
MLDVATTPEGAATDLEGDPLRVVYLLGAGATQGAVSYAGSEAQLIMPGLIRPLLERTSEAYLQSFGDHEGLRYLVNDVIDDKTDFEHLLTFLADTPSRRYQEFADRLRTVFATVLRSALERVRHDLGDRHSVLYAALIDMHAVPGSGEHLAGFLTLNYDNFLEHAIEQTLGRSVEYGMDTGGAAGTADELPIPVLKLHGSFSWRHVWPIKVAAEFDTGLWIPPGIRKAKGEYPFTSVWSAARELLDCDVLRIIGCNLGPNDWDLVSLLFSTMHGRESAKPYEIQVIGRPKGAGRMADLFPYLDPRSILEIPGIGAQLISELLGRHLGEFEELNEDERQLAADAANEKFSNPFERWLRVKGELMYQDLGTLETDAKVFQRFIHGSV